MYEEFERIVLKKLHNIWNGYCDYIDFQMYGFSQEQVKKFWKKMRKSYSLPRAKRIEQATISF
jgi:hypothetical protein